MSLVGPISGVGRIVAGRPAAKSFRTRLESFVHITAEHGHFKTDKTSSNFGVDLKAYNKGFF